MHTQILQSSDRYHTNLLEKHGALHQLGFGQDFHGIAIIVLLVNGQFDNARRSFA